MAFGPAHLLTAVEALVVAIAMVLAGLRMHALEHRRTRRRCPACGRDVRVCRCRS